MLIDRSRRPVSDPPAPTRADAVPSAPLHHGPCLATAARYQGRLLLARALIVLAVAGALSTQGLVTSAERLDFGPHRMVTVELATGLDDLATALWLDRPAGALRELNGRAPTQRRQAAPEAAQGAAPQAAQGAAPQAAQEAAIPPEAVPFAPSTMGTTARSEGAGGAAGSIDDLGAGPGGQSATTQSMADREPEPIEEPALRRVAPGEPLRVWAGGDSLGEYIGNHLLGELADPDLVTVDLDYHISTGLARPDYFDWPTRIAEVVGSPTPPDALVFMVGGNDNQNMLRDGEVLMVGTERWYADYGARVASIVDSADPTTTHVYWVGLPPMRDATRHQLSMGMNDAVRLVAENRPHVTFLDIETMFAGADGAYSAHIAAPDGELRLARQADGVHITFAGSTWVASDVWDLLVDRWEIGAVESPVMIDAYSVGPLD